MKRRVKRSRRPRGRGRAKCRKEYRCEVTSLRGFGEDFGYYACAATAGAAKKKVAKRLYGRAPSSLSCKVFKRNGVRV